MEHKKAKVLYLLHCYRNRGGVEEHTRDLARALSETHEIGIVAKEGTDVLFVQDEEIKFTLPSERLKWPLTPAEAPQTQHALDEVLQRFDPDVIHIQHFLSWPLGVIEQLTNSGIPVVVSFHDYFVITPFYTMQGAKSAPQALTPDYCKLIFGQDISSQLRARVESLQLALSKAKAWVTPSAYLAGELGSLYPFDFRVIEHGIDPLPAIGRTHQKTPRFGFVGTKLPQKGWLELLKGFQLLREKHPNVELKFFGGGQDAPKVASPGVSFSGAYSRDNLPRIFSQFEIGIIPSVFAETFSYVLSEMWSGGIVVAASNIGALAERITDNKNGKLFEPGNPLAIAETLQWFLENDDWHQWTLPEPRTIEEMAEDYERLYDMLIS